jgi:hypothetical protein
LFAIFALRQLSFFLVTASSKFMFLDNAILNIESIVAGCFFVKTAVGIPPATTVREVAGIDIKPHSRFTRLEYFFSWG